VEHGGEQDRGEPREIAESARDRERQNLAAADCADERGSERIAKIAGTAKIAEIKKAKPLTTKDTKEHKAKNQEPRTKSYQPAASGCPACYNNRLPDHGFC
jgi:hypothetical protein